MQEVVKDEGARKPFTAVVILLAVSVVVNYIDRGNLSLAAPLLKEELHISASQLGLLLSAFFWTYTAFQVVAGWLADRFSVNVVLGCGFLLWSVSTAATGLAQGFALILMMRLFLGAGESVMFPATSKILAVHLPEQKRGFANGLISASMRWGSAVGALGGGLFIARYGWRPVFIATGVLGLLWLPAWMHWRIPAKGHKARHGDEWTPGFGAVVRQRSFWGTASAHFCSNYLLYFLVTWLPFYLVKERHLSIGNMAQIAGLYYMVDATSAVVSGWLGDLWMRAGGTTTLVRKTTMSLGFSIAALGLGCCALAGPHTYLACLLVVGTGSGMASAVVFAFGQTLAGPRAAGKWIGLQNGVGNLAGVVCPALTGLLVDWTGHFVVALTLAAGVAVVGAVTCVVAVGKLEQVKWMPRRAEMAAATLDAA